jgi:hypothetical protein
MTARHRAGGRLAATEARDGAVPEVRELARRLLAEQRAQTASWGHGGGPGQELAALVEQFGMDRWRLPAERRFALECIVVGTVAFVWLGFLVWGLGGQRVTQAISHSQSTSSRSTGRSWSASSATSSRPPGPSPSATDRQPVAPSPGVA